MLLIDTVVRVSSVVPVYAWKFGPARQPKSVAGNVHKATKKQKRLQWGSTFNGTNTGIEARRVGQGAAQGPALRFHPRTCRPR